MISLAFALLLGPMARAERPLGCEFNYPIAGSAGFTNAQAARKTNTNTYSAAAFAERYAQDVGLAASEDFELKDGWGFIAGELNWTFGATHVPTFCDDQEPGELESEGPIDYHERWERKDRVYLQPLDLYATNLLLGMGWRAFGGFYSASVTQSVLGLRAANILMAQPINLYPLTFAPLVGNYSRGDGVSSYSVDWIGGVYTDTPYFGARAGYIGAKGFYGSADERILGLFGTAALGATRGSTPWDYLRAGLRRFSVRRFGLEKVADITGASSVFVRDLPVAGGVDLSESLIEQGQDRMRTFHVEQNSVYKLFDLNVAANLVDGGLYEGHLGVHTPDYHPERESLEGGRPGAAGFLLRLGMVDIPARYTLGVEGGQFFSARAEARFGNDDGTFFGKVLILFNDPEQLALYPFATNALTMRLEFNGGFVD